MRKDLLPYASCYLSTCCLLTSCMGAEYWLIHCLCNLCHPPGGQYFREFREPLLDISPPAAADASIEATGGSQSGAMMQQQSDDSSAVLDTSAGGASTRQRGSTNTSANPTINPFTGRPKGRAKVAKKPCGCSSCVPLSWEQWVRLLVQELFTPLGLTVEAVTRLPYLSQVCARVCTEPGCLIAVPVGVCACVH